MSMFLDKTWPIYFHIWTDCSFFFLLYLLTAAVFSLFASARIGPYVKTASDNHAAYYIYMGHGTGCVLGQRKRIGRIHFSTWDLILPCILVITISIKTVFTEKIQSIS